VIRALRDGMQVVAALACFVFGVSSASADSSEIVASRVQVFGAPSTTADVVSVLGRGAPVCVLDKSNYSGVMHRRPGWLAIRVPGGIGYVPSEAVDVPAPAGEVPDCGASASAPDAAVAQSPLIMGGFLPLRPARFMIGMGSGGAWLRKQVAMKNHFGDSGATLNGTLGLTIYDMFMISGSISGLSPSDQAPFSQVVVNAVDGENPHSEYSSLKVVSLSIEAGLRTPFWALGRVQNGWVAGALFAQYGTAGIYGGRSIRDCSNCDKAEFDLRGGTFWHAGFDLIVPSRSPRSFYGLTVAYQRYEAAAAVAQELRIGFNCWL
jgi:hypothetical protein